MATVHGIVLVALPSEARRLASTVPDSLPARALREGRIPVEFLDTSRESDLMTNFGKNWHHIHSINDATFFLMWIACGVFFLLACIIFMVLLVDIVEKATVIISVTYQATRKRRQTGGVALDPFSPTGNRSSFEMKLVKP
jgi:hypothetical protein